MSQRPLSTLAGGWFVQTGDSVPEEFIRADLGLTQGAGLGTVRLPVLSHGSVAALAALPFTATHVLTQEMHLPPAVAVVLAFDVAVYSREDSLPLDSLETSLGLDRVPNHQLRVDLLDPTASVFALGDAVLAPLFRTEVGEPRRSGYRRLVVDLSAFADRTVRLRFVALANGPLFIGIDNVRLLAR